MSFSGYKDVIEYGDTVIVYMGYESMLQFRVEKGAVHQTKFGALKHDGLVGLRFGEKVECAKGYVYVLHPTPELWTITLPHRTQILYSTDISMVTLQLDLKPGSIVIESGTGSASLSHAILRTITPGGHLYTFDFHEKRVMTAREEFSAHGFDESVVTVQHRDVCGTGFGLSEAIANAVFLDLPSPWEAVQFAAKCLVQGGRLCSFSPCIEQVQRTCAALRATGFSDITMLECLQRPLDVRTVVLPVVDLGYGPGQSYNSSNCSSELYQPVVGHIEVNATTGQRAASACAKKTKIETTANVERDMDADSSSEDGNIADAGQCDLKTKNAGVASRDQNAGKASFVCRCGMPALQMPGHTGFLTFATLYPK